MPGTAPGLPGSTTIADTEPVARCQLCGSGDRDLVFAEPPFEVVRCRECTLVYVTPRLLPTALAEVYGADYWKSDNPKARGYADYAREADLYLKTFQKRMALVSRWVKPGQRVLDVGCAAGYFLRVLKQHGCDVHGVEPSAPIATEAVEHLGADRVFVGDLAAAITARGWQPGTFDLITLWDVIEHIPDPQATLRRLRPLLAPGGRLLLETQNVGSRWARWLGRRWHHYKHAEHLYHFDPVTIRRLLADSGFTAIQIGSAWAGKYVSLRFIAERAGKLGRIPGLLASPLALVGNVSLYVNPRDEIIVVAEPKA